MNQEIGPTIAVVIAPRDRPRLLDGALEALGRSIRAPDRVVVVDSASTDRRVAEVARARGATVVSCDRPGTCRARNAGWRTVDDPIVAFIDDDCLVEPDWLAAILKAFEHPSAPGFVTGQVRADVEPSARAGLSLALTLESEPRAFRAGDDPKSMGHGANMAWRREALERIGGFDEALGPGAPLRAAEDLDVFWRALRSGEVGYYSPDAVVIHRQWRSRLAMLRAYYGYGVGTGALTVKRSRLEISPAPHGVAAAVLRILLVDEGLKPVAKALSDRYEMGAIAELAKLAGSVSGAWRARRFPVDEGHFRSTPKRLIVR